MSGTDNPGTAAARYNALVSGREPFLIRGRDAAQLTMPYLIPPLGFNASMRLPTPYQSLGSRGVRNLASKFLLALFPSNTPFFKYEIDDFLLEKLAKTDGARGAFETAMSRRERAIMTELDKSLFRTEAFAAFLHMVVGGNALIYVPPKGRCRHFRLDQYVVRRDPSGNILEIVVEEAVSLKTLPTAARAAIEAREHTPEATGTPHSGTADKGHKLYTYIWRTEDDSWKVYQECCGVILPGSDGSYPADDCPWIPLRMSSQPNEDYGRGYVEEMLGDLDSLESLSQTLVEGTAAVARVLFLVKPNGVTRVKVVAQARNGSVQVGNAEDVTVAQAQAKSADFQTAQKQAETIAGRISYAFLLNSSVQRNGDRVTAEEIRYMAGELDDALGGIYTLLAAEFQLPVVQAFERRMQKSRNVPALPSGVVNPTITTGMSALGRGNDLQNLKAFVADVIQIVGPQEAFTYLNPGEFLKRAVAAYGIDPGGLLNSDDQVQAMKRMAAQNAAVQHLGPHAINGMAGLAKQAMANQAQQQETSASS